MTSRLQFQENGLSIFITIPPRVGLDNEGAVCARNEGKVVSLDRLYSAAADRKHEEAKDLSASKLPFLWKLYELLDDVEVSGQDNIVSWVDHGRGFRVHKVEEFVSSIIPKYTRISKYKSFQRQLYFYGFTRVSSGEHKGAYYHPSFRRGQKTLCLSMIPKNNSHRRSISRSIVEKRSQCVHGSNETTLAAVAGLQTAWKIPPQVLSLQNV